MSEESQMYTAWDRTIQYIELVDGNVEAVPVGAVVRGDPQVEDDAISIAVEADWSFKHMPRQMQVVLLGGGGVPIPHNYEYIGTTFVSPDAVGLVWMHFYWYEVNKT